MRDERKDYLLKACIHNFLWYALGDFLEALTSEMDGMLQIFDEEETIDIDIRIDLAQVWKPLEKVSADLWETEKKNSRYENDDAYLVNIGARAEEMLEKSLII